MRGPLNSGFIVNIKRRIPYTKFTQRLRSFAKSRCLISYPVALPERNAGSRQRD
jgi:hypothetical protein